MHWHKLGNTTYLDLVKDCRDVAPRVFSNPSAMFPQGLQAMCSLDPALLAVPLVVQIRRPSLRAGSGPQPKQRFVLAKLKHYRTLVGEP